MAGFESIDQTMVKEALEEFLPDTATITRPSNSRTSGDMVPGSASAVASSVPVRVMPVSSRLRGFPEALVEEAEYVITIKKGSTYKDGDIVTVGSNTYRLTALRYETGSWLPVYRALAVRYE